ncbi:hypothetical protein E4631_04555 [Hymenobacter sp. UV11]|uniref:hypothetical protein n=1 Tax=Hymenobacter sp. UV11 TaxID=1849735 RepID=UPI00105E87C8|nr:hypothetical protein [Hymenobacter sp. UV11]TDN35924.1 hypothetical protein A8B98_10935 [Hymenobacter sp. UV11]TFZ68266.1 hypothetical protein E4631_04555 [Hymenobacter sp. UV11]
MRSLWCATAWLGATALSHAQVLPVPNARNLDWVLDKTTLGTRPSRPDSLPGGRDQMPIVDPNRQGGVAAMPNALAKSITGSGNYHQYWDAARKLNYEWQSRLGQLAPDSLVTVKQQDTGATFTYRRAARQWKAR